MRCMASIQATDLPGVAGRWADPPRHPVRLVRIVRPGPVSYTDRDSHRHRRLRLPA